MDWQEIQVDVERAAGYAAALEKKQRAFDRVMEEWKKKCDDLAAELEGAQHDNRNLSTELFKAKSVQDELLEVNSFTFQFSPLKDWIWFSMKLAKNGHSLCHSLHSKPGSNELKYLNLISFHFLQQIESLRRENKSLSLEIKDLTDQLTEGGRTVHELQKMIRRLESEKEELQKALDDAESALEAEEAKVLRAQVAFST